MITAGALQEPHQPSRRRRIARRLRTAVTGLRVPARKTARSVGPSLAKRAAWQVVSWTARTLLDTDVQLLHWLQQLLMP
ncbi:hypothetical protein [Streptomyces radiopugnans]|uniref:hypothetical protein n=1 Tax=Streptomyces radiopugnans TaxID=403935 RepID=UPI003F1C376D